MDMQEINVQISRLVQYGLQQGLMDEEDTVYGANRLLEKLGLSQFQYCPPWEELPYPAEPLQALCEFAAEQGIISPDTGEGREQFDTELMDCLMPRPSEIVRHFRELYQESPQAATEYYYDLSRASNYIRVDRVEKDKLWTAPTKYGDLVITINLSKPEKDPRAIAAAKNAPPAIYPKCALCRENEGFLGSANQAPRGNHRLIPISLCGEKWFLQYSPYVYYNEHCIVLSEDHRPMKVSRGTFEHLLDFVTVLPHYFVGSNADLPIVGGSILSHDHYQGGNFEFPMAKAPLREKATFRDYEDVEGGIVDWPMSVIRLRSEKKERLIDLADRILRKWRKYSDARVNIQAFTGDVPHNTITPIARRRGDAFELDLVLRNNRTTEEHPLGLFHPHAQYHHIKKENIGLIEVMGLAILPPRLLAETKAVAQALSCPEQAEEIMARPEMEQHRAWIEELQGKSIPPAQIQEAVENSVGEIFGKILGDAGVYKDTDEGRAAFLRFCDSV